MITAADGEQAVAVATERLPAICVIDVMMPKLDGYGVTERLRATPAHAKTPIVLLTASVDEAAVKRGFDAGADDYIKKPFSPRELVERVAASAENAVAALRCASMSDATETDTGEQSSARFASSSPSPVSTATTAARRSSRAPCATAARR